MSNPVHALAVPPSSRRGLRTALAVWLWTFLIPGGALLVYVTDAAMRAGRTGEGLAFSTLLSLALIAPCAPVGLALSRIAEAARSAPSSWGVSALYLLGGLTGCLAQLVIPPIVLAIISPPAGQATSDALLALTYAYPGWPIMIPILGTLAGLVVGGRLWRSAAVPASA